jgi:hypothetical protein
MTVDQRSAGASLTSRIEMEELAELQKTLPIRNKDHRLVLGLERR